MAKKRLPKTAKAAAKAFNKRFKIPAPIALAGFVLLAIAHIGVELYNDFHPVLPAPKQMQVCFTPDRGCQKLLLKHLNNAQKSIYIQAFSFTDTDIGLALVNAKNRGVTLKTILDKGNETNKKSLIRLLGRQKIPIRLDSPGGIAHNKLMIIDETIVITGSYNFTTNAYERNTENLLFLNDQGLAKIYLENWQKRWEKSGKFN